MLVKRAEEAAGQLDRNLAILNAWKNIGERILGIRFFFRLATFVTLGEGTNLTFMFTGVHHYRTRVRPGTPPDDPTLLEMDKRYDAAPAKDGPEVLDFLNCAVAGSALAPSGCLCGTQWSNGMPVAWAAGRFSLPEPAHLARGAWPGPRQAPVSERERRYPCCAGRKPRTLLLRF
jgi:hypothetical protein